jgi:hypothetical protein
MKNQLNKGMSGLLLLLGAACANAAELKGVVGIGMDFGGDVLLSGSYTDGSTWEARANQGLLLNAGIVVVTGEFETQATVGYKFGGPSAKNGSVTFDVIPVELMEFYRTGNIRAGLGISYHNSPKLVVDVPGYVGNGTYNFDNALGYVAQVGWAPSASPFSVDLRYTAVNFKPQGGGTDVKASVVGLYASLYF